MFENQLTDLQNGDRLYYLARTPGMNLRTQLEGNSFAEMIMRNTDGATRSRPTCSRTADCKFQLGNLAGTPAGYTASGPSVADDPTTDCNENLLLLRKPDGTIQYQEKNTVDPSRHQRPVRLQRHRRRGPGHRRQRQRHLLGQRRQRRH